MALNQKGLYTNSELVDTLIVDLNNVLKELVSGQYIQACCYVTQMSQKLVNLRKTIDKDLQNKDRIIEELKSALNMVDNGEAVTNTETPVTEQEKESVE